MPKAYITKEEREIERIKVELTILRKRSRKSQGQIAAELGISRQAYGNKERDANMSIKEFLTVCHILGAEPGEIITEACR